MTSSAPAPASAVNRKARTGVVVSDKNDKTVIVAIVRAQRHRLYHKVIRRTKRYQVHDPENQATIGDLVRIEECRPISKNKRWQLVEVLTERDVAEVQATEIDRDLVDVQRSAARAAAEEEEAAAERPEASVEASGETPAAEASTPVEASAEADTGGEPATETTEEGEQAER